MTCADSRTSTPSGPVHYLLLWPKMTKFTSNMFIYETRFRDKNRMSIKWMWSSTAWFYHLYQWFWRPFPARIMNLITILQWQILCDSWSFSDHPLLWQKMRWTVIRIRMRTLWGNACCKARGQYTSDGIGVSWCEFVVHHFVTSISHLLMTIRIIWITVWYK